MLVKQGLLIGFCLLAVLGFISAERVRYDNYHVYKAVPENEEQLAVLKELEGFSDSLLFLDGVHIVGSDIKIVVVPHKIPDILEIFGRSEIKYELLEKNLQKHLDNDYKEVAPSGRAASYGWTQYYQLDDTYMWLQSLARTYPGVVTLIEGGKSYQGRSILGVKISKSRTQKPGIFVEAGIHAREWISPATSTYIINQLLTSQQPSIKDLAENYDWYIFPHVNPDGYVYTHTTNRLWRKTRRPYGSCFGADANRNWAFHWMETGASNNPCSETYAGPIAFSEIETKSLSDYIASLRGKIQLYLSFHSYSQYLLYPYGHTNQLPDNVQDYRQVFSAAVSAVSKRYGTKYTGGNVYDAIYPAAGSSTDWAYGTQNIRMAFCYELRPSPSAYFTGFRLPADQIIPTGQETLDSVTALIGEVRKLNYFN